LIGETRLFIIVGDPIAQVKLPASGLAGNLDGIIATVPHKFAATAHCATAWAARGRGAACSMHNSS